MHFIAMHLHIGRGFDPEPDLAAFDAEHHDANIGTRWSRLLPGVVLRPAYKPSLACEYKYMDISVSIKVNLSVDQRR
jgi:hypothetical protein